MYNVKGWYHSHHRHRGNSQGSSGTDIRRSGLVLPVIIHHPSSSYCYLFHGERVRPEFGRLQDTATAAATPHHR